MQGYYDDWDFIDPFNIACGVWECFPFSKSCHFSAYQLGVNSPSSLALENHQVNSNIDKLKERERHKRLAEADTAASSAFAVIKDTDPLVITNKIQGDGDNNVSKDPEKS